MSWSSGIAEWTERNTAFTSGVFSWNLQKVYMRCKYYQSLGFHVRVGGQVVVQNPKVFMEFDTSGSVNAVEKHNPNATFTSRGCIRKCSFCLVPKIEGKLVELEDWNVKPIVCDNNLLATSDEHFNSVIDKLLESGLDGIDFNQGLDARILTNHHATRFSELPKDTLIRLAWDHVKTENLYMEAFEKLINAGIGKKQIRTYVLIGYKDKPEDALYRLEKIRSLGSMPNPMRFQPLDSKKKNSFVGANWTEKLLIKFMRYYSNLRYTGKYSFEKYKRAEKIFKKHEKQLELI